MTKVIYCDKTDCIFHSDRDEYDLNYLCRLDHIRIKDGRCEEYINIDQLQKREPMGDLISREDALMCARPEYLNPNQEKLASYNQGRNNAIEMYYRQIAELPTAEPLVTVEAKQNEGLYLNTDEETLLETEYIVVATDGMYKEYIHETDGKPRRGKWIDHPTVENIGLMDLQGNEMEIVMKMCSECGYEGWETDYCPSCGAKMERSE